MSAVAKSAAVTEPTISVNPPGIQKKIIKDYFSFFTGHLPDSIFVTDYNGRILEHNPSAEKMFSCQPAEIVGQDICLILKAKKDILFFKRVLRSINNGTLVFDTDGHADEQIPTANGHLIRVQITIIPTDNKATDSILFCLRDIPQRDKNDIVLQEPYKNALTRQMIQTITSIARMVEMHDPYTAAHQRRVAHLGRAIANELGLPYITVDSIYLGAWLHDVGKTTVPQTILCRPGRLDPPSMALVRQHCSIGYEIVRYIDFTWPIAQIVLQHHERLDGSGYPKRLTGNRIRTESAIVAIADVVEAMSSHRPYRPSLGIDVALHEITTKPHLYAKPAAEACQRLFCHKGYQFPEPG